MVMNHHKITVNGVNVQNHVALSKYTFTRTGGPADYLAIPQTSSQVGELVRWAHQHQLPVTVIGNASNLIIRDGGLRGLVIILTGLHQVRNRHQIMVAGAGAPIISVSVAARRLSLSGLEFAAGIPGSVGGAVFMNAGAYGGSTSQVLQSAEVMNRDGEIKVLSRDELDFSYRHSSLQDHPGIVLSATFKLRRGNPDHIQARMDNFNAQRAAKQPLDRPSCGSVFKRPQGHYAGQLIHDAKLQGYRSGGAQVSKVHAGFIVNVNHATATDYLNVIHHVQDQVFKNSGVHLQTEVRIIGDRR